MVCTDNATIFISADIQELICGNCIAHRTIEPKHSGGNGLAERPVREVKLAMQRCTVDGVCMNLALQRWLFQQRRIPHSKTSVSPAELILGRRPKSRLDLIHPDLRRIVLSEQEKQRTYSDRTAKVLDQRPSDR